MLAGTEALAQSTSVSIVPCGSGGDVVLVDQESCRLLALNASGALFYGCLDGSSSIEEIAGDLAAEFGVSFASVFEEVTAVAEILLAAGLASARNAESTHSVAFTSSGWRPEWCLSIEAVGNRAVSVAGDSTDILDTVVSWLKPGLLFTVDRDPEPGRFDLELRADVRGGSLIGSHSLYRRDRHIHTTPDRSYFLWSVAQQLAALFDADDSVVRLHCDIAMLGDETVVLVCGPFRDTIQYGRARLERFGWRLASPAVVTLQDGNVRIVPSISPTDLLTEAAATQLAASVSDPLLLKGGYLRPTHFLATASVLPRHTLSGRAGQVVVASDALAGRGASAQGVLALIDLLDRVEFVQVDCFDPSDLLAGLTAIRFSTERTAR